MPKLIRIGGDDLLKILLKKGFVLVRQKSSHVRLVFQLGENKQFLTIPLHSELDRGTLKSIIRSVQKCLSKEEIIKLFYK